MVIRCSLSGRGCLSRKIDRLDLQTGQRILWHEIALADLAGLIRSQSGVTVAANGSFCYTHMQALAELDLVL
jgi:hypothetical protein